MPDNPVSGKAGNVTRMQQMLNYFNNNEGFDAEFVSLRDWGFWNIEDEVRFKKAYPNIKLHLIEKKYKKNIFKYLFLYKIPYFFKRNSIDMSSYAMRRDFKNIVDKVKFDKVIVSYASWGKIIDTVPNASYFIIDTHDFLTAQAKNKERIGKLFQDEINILRKYDEIWTYSTEEEYIFGQFTDKNVVFIPISFPEENQKKDEPYYKYEVLYVASQNPHNVKGFHWFMKEVLPNLKEIKINVIGKICEVIEEHPQIVKHGIVDSLKEYYENSKISICPMLTGTGIKVKVLESLSYGIPVVTNRRGVDGILNKTENGCLVSENGMIFAENINMLLNNDSFYAEIQNNAKEYFLKNHTRQKEMKILNDIFFNDK